MDLKTEARLAIAQLSDVGKFNEQAFRTLVDSAIQAVVDCPTGEHSTADIPSNQKVIFSSLVYLVVEASKNNAESLELRYMLVKFFY
jgi:hypothetical protein